MGQLHIIGIRQCISHHDWCTQGNWGMPRKVSAKPHCAWLPHHLIDFAAKDASSALPYSIDSLLIDVFYYLKASVNRKLNLKKFQMLIGNEVQAVLKHACTRWLSLGQCLPRFIHQWQALVLFFEGEVSAEQKTPTQQTKQKKPTQQNKATKNSVQTSLVPKKPTPAVKNEPAQGSQLKVRLENVLLQGIYSFSFHLNMAIIKITRFE